MAYSPPSIVVFPGEPRSKSGSEQTQLVKRLASVGWALSRQTRGTCGRRLSPLESGEAGPTRREILRWRGCVTDGRGRSSREEKHPPSLTSPTVQINEDSVTGREKLLKKNFDSSGYSVPYRYSSSSSSSTFGSCSLHAAGREDR